MRKFMIAAIALTIPAIAFALTPDEMVKARQEHMKAMGKQVGVFAAMAKGEVAYDPAAAQAAADALVAQVNKDTAALWAPGTSSADMPGVSEAKPALWDSPDKVKALGGDLHAQAMNMQAEAGKGKAEMVKALGTLGGTCRACHSDFKLDD